MVKKWDFEIQAAAEALLLRVISFEWFYLCGIGRILSCYNSMRDFAIGFAVLFFGQVVVKKHLLSKVWGSAGCIYLLMTGSIPMS